MARSRRGHKYKEKYDSVNSISINNKKRMSKKNIKKDSNGNLKLFIIIMTNVKAKENKFL